MPIHFSEALGKYFVIKYYVDANHAVNMTNRRLHSGNIVNVNNAPIIWYSKRQNTVKASSFGLDFVYIRIVIGIIEALSYKLRYFVIMVEGLVEVFLDNMSVNNNPSIPTSVLN